MTVDIAPDRPCVLAAAADRTPISDVADPIEANLVRLDDGQTRVLIVSLDALYAGVHIRRALEEALTGQLDPSAIMVAASHTHLSPSLDYGKPDLGLPDPVHLAAVTHRIVKAAINLMSGPAVPVVPSYARYRSHAAISRRMHRLLGGAEGRVKLNSVFRGPNPEGTPLHHGHVIVLHDQGGDPVSLIWQLPCHPVSAPTKLISAHFPGYVRLRLRNEWEKDLPVVFLQGHSGDLRPPSVAAPRGLAGLARRTFLGPWFGDFTPEAYYQWLAGVYSQFEEAMVASRPIVGELTVRHQREVMPLRHLAEAEPPLENREASVQRISIGPLDLVGVSAEPVAAWGQRIENNAPTGRSRIPVGCIDDTFGYAPTGAMLREGGYEASGFCRHFQLRRLKPNFALTVATLFERVFQD